MIVADTTLITHFFLNTELSSVAYKVFEKDPNWITPSLWQAEFANVLVKVANASQNSSKTFLPIYQNAWSFLHSREQPVDMQSVIRLATKKGITAYDAHFVVMALEHDIKLITEDKELIKKFPNTAFSIKSQH